MSNFTALVVAGPRICIPWEQALQCWSDSYKYINGIRPRFAHGFKSFADLESALDNLADQGEVYGLGYDYSDENTSDSRNSIASLYCIYFKNLYGFQPDSLYWEVYGCASVSAIVEEIQQEFGYSVELTDQGWHAF
jgi:hypothetical protein